MPRSVRDVSLEALCQRKRALFERDPIRGELTDAVLALIGAGDGTPEYDRASRACGRLRDRIERKYGVRIYIPERGALLALREAGVPDHELRALSWTPTVGSVGAEPFRTARNWGWPGELRQVWQRVGRRVPKARRPPEGQPHTLTIAIDLEQIGHHDLNRIAKQVKVAVREGLRDLPPPLRRPPSQRTPKHLAFLRSTEEATFRRDVRRYDLWARGLSFRLIALLDEPERSGRGLSKPPTPRRVGFPVRGEDAVKKSVARIFAAIHDKAYPSRKAPREAAGPEQPFACPTHPGGCPDTKCPNLRDFMQRFDAAHPV